MAQKISALPNDAKIKLITFLGQKVVWRKIGANLTGMPSDSVTFIADQIVAMRPFDGKEPNNTDSNRKNYGNNDYTVSNIRQWLNSSAGASQWWSSQHQYDAAPTSANSSCNAYDADPGFLNGATAQELAILLATDRKIGGRSGNGTTCTDKVFLLTTDELGLETLGAANGTKIPYFVDNNARKATVTAACVTDSDYGSDPSANSAWYYWTATSYSSNSYTVRHVGTDGSLCDGSAWDWSLGVRPACNLSSSILVSDTASDDGCYQIIYNSAPTAPTPITVPETIQSTKQIQISWGKSTDTDGNLDGYTLQRNLDDSTWTQIYRGSGTSYTDTIEYGKTSVQYRVQAYDKEGATSNWTTSDKRTVLNNRAPQISGTDHDLGEFGKTGPTLDYTVTDLDNDSVAVVETLDGVQLKSYTADLGQSKSVKFEGVEWTKILNGSHTIEVTATDPMGASATRSCTFSKKLTQIDVKLASPLAADDMPTMATVNVQGQFPAGSELHVYMCNNGNDAEPSWQDVTDAALHGKKVFFDNESKTAQDWAVDVHVTLDRGSAVGDCFLSSIGGNFQ